MGLRMRQVAPIAVGVLYLHLIFEYLRIHEIFPIIGNLRIQTATTAALILIVITQTGKGGVRLVRQSWLLLSFLGLSVFTVLVARNNFYAYQFAYVLTLILISFFAITHILQNERDLKRFLSLLIGIHIYLALKGILGFSRAEFSYSNYSYGFASTGTVGASFLGDENDVALAMILILPLAMYLFRRARSLPGRLFWGAGSAAMFLTVLFTFSRGGFVGLAAMMLYWVVTSKKKGKAIACLVLASALAITVAPSQYWSRIETIGDTSSGTAMNRRNYWAAARRMFYDSPIWGVGGNNFGVLLPDYGIEFEPEKRARQWGRASHSLYFDVLAEFGLIGAFLISSVIVLSFRNLRQVIALDRMGRCPPVLGDLAHSLRLSWVGFLVPATFLSVLTYPHLYYLTALTVVVHRLALVESEAMAVEPIGSVGTAV